MCIGIFMDVWVYVFVVFIQEVFFFLWLFSVELVFIGECGGVQVLGLRKSIYRRICSSSIFLGEVCKERVFQLGLQYGRRYVRRKFFSQVYSMVDVFSSYFSVLLIFGWNLILVKLRDQGFVGGCGFWFLFFYVGKVGLLVLVYVRIYNDIVL